MGNTPPSCRTEPEPSETPFCNINDPEAEKPTVGTSPNLIHLKVNEGLQNNSKCCGGISWDSCVGAYTFYERSWPSIIYPNGEFAIRSSNVGCDRLNVDIGSIACQNPPNCACGHNGGFCCNLRGVIPEIYRTQYLADPLQCILNELQGGKWKKSVRAGPDPSGNRSLRVTCDPKLKKDSAEYKADEGKLYNSTLQDYCSGIKAFKYMDSINKPKYIDQATQEEFVTDAESTKEAKIIADKVLWGDVPARNDALYYQFYPGIRDPRSTAINQYTPTDTKSPGVDNTCTPFHSELCAVFCTEYPAKCEIPFQKCCKVPDAFDPSYNSATPLVKSTIELESPLLLGQQKVKQQAIFDTLRNYGNTETTNINSCRRIVFETTTAPSSTILGTIGPEGGICSFTSADKNVSTVTETITQQYTCNLTFTDTTPVNRLKTTKMKKVPNATTAATAQFKFISLGSGLQFSIINGSASIPINIDTLTYYWVIPEPTAPTLYGFSFGETAAANIPIFVNWDGVTPIEQPRIEFGEVETVTTQQFFIETEFCKDLCFFHRSTEDKLTAITCDKALTDYCRYRQSFFDTTNTDVKVGKAVSAGSNKVNLPVTGKHKVKRIKKNKFEISVKNLTQLDVLKKMHTLYPVCDCFLKSESYSAYFNDLVSGFPPSESLNQHLQDMIKIPACSFPNCSNDLTKQPRMFDMAKCPVQINCFSNAQITLNAQSINIDNSSLTASNECSSFLKNLGSNDKHFYVPITELTQLLIDDAASVPSGLSMIQASQPGIHGNYIIKKYSEEGDDYDGDYPEGTTIVAGTGDIIAGGEADFFDTSDYLWYGVNPQVASLQSIVYNQNLDNYDTLNEDNEFTQNPFTESLQAVLDDSLEVGTEVLGTEVDYIIDQNTGAPKMFAVPNARWFRAKINFVTTGVDGKHHSAKMTLEATNESNQDDAGVSFSPHRVKILSTLKNIRIANTSGLITFDELPFALSAGTKVNITGVMKCYVPSGSETAETDPAKSCAKNGDCLGCFDDSYSRHDSDKFPGSSAAQHVNCPIAGKDYYVIGTPSKTSCQLSLTKGGLALTTIVPAWPDNKVPTGQTMAGTAFVFTPITELPRRPGTNPNANRGTYYNTHVGYRFWQIATADVTVDPFTGKPIVSAFNDNGYAMALTPDLPPANVTRLTAPVTGGVILVVIVVIGLLVVLSLFLFMNVTAKNSNGMSPEIAALF